MEKRGKLYMTPRHVEEMQAYDDEERNKVGVPRGQMVLKPRPCVHTCKSRRKIHFVNLEDPSFLHILDLMIAKTQVVENNRHNPEVAPYNVYLQCSKDRGDSCKECKKLLDADKFVTDLLAVLPSCTEERREDVQRGINKLQAHIMNVILAKDTEIREHSGFARYSICPRGGCPCATGFRIQRDRYEFAKVIRCPHPGCMTDGEPSWWCSLCNTKHHEHQRCVISDPRDMWDEATRAFHDKEVAEGREQYCTCGAVYGKDEGCDSIHCPRRNCQAHICFGCGVEIDDNYVENHIIMGPPDEMHPHGRYGCRRTLIRNAAADKPRHRQWLEASVRCRPLMRDVEAVLADELRPLDDAGRIFLSGIVREALNMGTIRR
jgi:hypothetical protein